MTHPRSVWLVRHGQTDWNLSRRYLSVSDRVLTAFGERQARALGVFFNSRTIDVIVHTGLGRTGQTADVIKGARQVAIECDPRWREASHGAWEGLTYRDVLGRYRDEALRRFSDPVNGAARDGETLAQMSARMLSAWRELGQRHAQARIVVVTHAGPIQALLCALMHTPLEEYWRWRIDLGSATGIDCYPTTTILRAVNVVPKLHSAGLASRGIAGIKTRRA